MQTIKNWKMGLMLVWLSVIAYLSVPTLAQMIDKTSVPNASGEGLAKSLAEQIGTGRGDPLTPNSSRFIISRDPFRSIRRGRQLFQRKFTRAQGLGPAFGDGAGNINTDLAIGAGLADSCAACHGRPRGSAGSGGDVVTRPDSRDAPHLFGLGLKEMLADEITADLRAIRDLAIASARREGRDVKQPLRSKGIRYGQIIAHADGSVNTSFVEGVDADLRVRPFFAHVGTAAPYGQDGRSINLMEVILRHGGEAQSARDEFSRLPATRQMAVIEFLNSLVIFPPDDTASNLDPGNRFAGNFPQFGHGGIKLTTLFNDPTDIE